MIYWANVFGSKGISEANLDGSGSGSDVNTGGATVNQPDGVAIDPATNKIYWANFAGGISEANLDGSGSGSNLNTTGATVASPAGVAIDPATNKIYWANGNGSTISEANLDGSGDGHDLNTAPVTPDHPDGVAIDPATNKIYWANLGSFTISEANLDGSGSGSTLNTTGATVVSPAGVAIDPATNKIYWANNGGNTISEANLDGSGEGHDLNTSGATVDHPAGVAIDPTANKIYWANGTGNTISEANLDGSGDGHNLSTAGATADDPSYPSLLELPTPAGAPKITGAGHVGSTLTCTGAGWEADELGGFLFRAPRMFGSVWQLNGTDIASTIGVTPLSSMTLAPSQPGGYSCGASATNQAGTSTQSSAQVQVSSIKPVLHCVVPKLQGKSLKVDRKKLREAGCKLGKVKGKKSRSAKVAKQSPKPGTVLAPGAKVNVKLGGGNL